MRTLPRTALFLLILAACGGDGSPGELRVERDSVGDTVVVRTLAGSEWGAPGRLEPEVTIGEFDGEDHYMFGQVSAIAVGPDGAMYAMDTQVPALRKYDAQGNYVATFGREGSGPGEYKGPDGGLVVLSDGRVVLRDPANARLQVYAPTGEALGTVPIRGNFNTSNPMVADTAGRIHTQILLDPEANVSEWKAGLVAYDLDLGQAVDTIPAPEWEFEAPRLMAQHTGERGTSTSINGVPFSPQSDWAFSPFGHMVGGIATRYAIDQYHRDGRVTRIERVVEPVPVQGDERANREEQATWSLRRTQPDWSWNGPPIPDHKPPFRDIQVGRDGRIWVLLHAAGERIPEEELDPPSQARPDARPVDRWREPVVFDVFEPDGTYLGLVHGPRGFSTYPTPVFDGDRVWAIVRDDLDVQYLTRFRVVLPETETAG